MANMLDTLRAKRDAGEISTSSTGAKIAGEGHYVVQLTNAEWGKNRNGDAEQGKLIFKVIGARKDTDPEAIGGVFTEYVSVKNEDMANKKYLQISDWLSAAGVKDEKMVDEDDEGIQEALRTLILCAQKYASKKEITANCFRKASDKVDSNGRPYYNNYFDDPNADASDDDEVEQKTEKKKEAPKKDDAVVGKSPYKTKSKNKVEDDED